MTTGILLFDLDGTLYPANCGYVEHIRKNIFEFMYCKGFVPRSQSAEEVWKPIFRKYNQSFRGLKASGMVFDSDEYWTFHRSGVEQFLSADNNLRKVLQNLSQEKYIFTNCNEKQAIEALECLGIADCFNGIFGASFMGDHCKPEEIVYEQVLKELKVENPSEVILFEDSFKNLVTANKLGMKTVFIESITSYEEGVTDAHRSILNIVLPTLSDLTVVTTIQKTFPEFF